jgi:hypothetical protein
MMDEQEEDEEENALGISSMAKQMGETVSRQIAQKCLKVLLCLLVDNFTNQLHVADHFPILLAQVKMQRLAVMCVEEMLKENLAILQTKVRQREIDIFVDLLHESEMSVTFLKLIKSACSCPMGVDATQRMVVNALFASLPIPSHHHHHLFQQQQQQQQSPPINTTTTTTIGNKQNGDNLIAIMNNRISSIMLPPNNNNNNNMLMKQQHPHHQQQTMNNNFIMKSLVINIIAN